MRLKKGKCYRFKLSLLTTIGEWLPEGAVVIWLGKESRTGLVELDFHTFIYGEEKVCLAFSKNIILSELLEVL